MSLLAINDLRVTAHDKTILHGVTLRIHSGEIHAVMGPNGSGKSTLAHTIAGHPLYSVAGGDITLDDHSLIPMSPDERARQGVFLAFQHPIEVSGVSVMQFLRAMWEARFGAIGPHNTLTSAVEFRTFVLAQAETLSVPKKLLQRNVNEGFSGGERKRLEILQMALLAPRFAVLDETDSGLDIDAVQIVAAGARQVAAAHHTGLLVITHYQRILEFLQPDFVHVLVTGKIVQSGGAELAHELEKKGYRDWVSSDTSDHSSAP